MRHRRSFSGIGSCLILLVFLTGASSAPAGAALLYKNYVVRNAGGQDILCDPYLVQPDDYVLKLFRDRGEISQVDFPEFLKLFRRINPQIGDIDTILPGQQIFIPLKKLDPDTVSEQDSGVVTIPFMTSSGVDDLLRTNSEAYQVRKGDSVSKLVATRFGRYGTRAFEEGLQIFKTVNPDIGNLDVISVGRTIILPQAALQNQPWYESLFDESGTLVSSLGVDNKTSHPDGSKETAAAKDDGKEMTPLARAAHVLEGNLYQKGCYFFPRAGQSDYRLDLATYSILEMKDGGHVVVIPSADKGKTVPEADLAVLRNYWKDLTVAELPTDASLAQTLDAVIESLPDKSASNRRVFTDEGVEVTVEPQWMLDRPQQAGSLAVNALGDGDEPTPRSVIDYLKHFGIVLKEAGGVDTGSNQTKDAAGGVSLSQIPTLDASSNCKEFVRGFFGVLGAAYSEHISFTFPYAGVQVSAVGNLLNRSDGISVVIDFGDLQGDAAVTINKAGMKVIQVQPNEPVATLVPKLLTAAGMTCDPDPKFYAAKRSGAHNTLINIPGFLGGKNQTPQVLLTSASLHDNLVSFLKDKGIGVIALTNMSPQ